MNNQITVCPMCPDCPDNCPVEAEMGATDRNVGDTIYRQDAIDVTWEKMTYTEQWYVLTEVRRRLKALPSAQPEQKSGKWIYDGVKRICPFCKDFIVTGRPTVKYCWNCGARLKERSEDANSVV